MVGAVRCPGESAAGGSSGICGRLRGPGLACRARDVDLDLAIVGGGPAGIATALFFAAAAPHRRDRLVVLEKESYPREKICAGALGARADRLLGTLGVRVDVPSVSISGFSVVTGSGGLCAREPGASAAVGRVVRRVEFDRALADEAQRPRRSASPRGRASRASRSSAGGSPSARRRATSAPARSSAPTAWAASCGERSARREVAGWRRQSRSTRPPSPPTRRAICSTSISKIAPCSATGGISPPWSRARPWSVAGCTSSGPIRAPCPARRATPPASTSAPASGRASTASASAGTSASSASPSGASPCTSRWPGPARCSWARPPASIPPSARASRRRSSTGRSRGATWRGASTAAISRSGTGRACSEARRSASTCARARRSRRGFTGARAPSWSAGWRARPIWRSPACVISPASTCLAGASPRAALALGAELAATWRRAWW